MGKTTYLMRQALCKTYQVKFHFIILSGGSFLWGLVFTSVVSMKQSSMELAIHSKTSLIQGKPGLVLKREELSCMHAGNKDNQFLVFLA